MTFKAESFSAGLADYARRRKISLEQASEEAIIRWFTATIMTTPVDTGRARGNWMCTRDIPNRQGPIERTDTNGGSTVQQVVSQVRGQGFAKYYLSNNLPYIEALEYGSSAQAPEGMVRRSLLALQQSLERGKLK